MRHIFGFLLAMAVFASPASAAAPVAKQGGFVCNSEHALKAFEQEQRRSAKQKHSIATIAKKISTPRDWCIAGVVKRTRRSFVVHKMDPLAMDIAVAIVGTIPYVGGFFAHRISEQFDRESRTRGYTTERGGIMFLVTPAQHVETQQALDPAAIRRMVEEKIENLRQKK